MMTKQSSQLKMLFKKIAIIPLVIGLLFLFANRVEAQEKGDAIKSNSEQTQNANKTPDILKSDVRNEEDKEQSATNKFLASVERTENSIRLKCYDCYRWADLKLKLNTEYIINDFGFSEGKTIESDKYAFTIKATKNQVVFKGLKNTAWKDLKFNLNNNTQQFFNQLGMVSNQKKVTPEMIKEYNSLSKEMKTFKKSSQFKLKDIQRIKFIFHLMTDKQKASAESYPFLPPPPPLIKKQHEKNAPPPPPAKKESTKKKLQKLRIVDDVPPPPPPKAKKDKLKNVPPPPPIPANATKEQKKAYKKAIEKYKKSQKKIKNIPPPPPPKAKKDKLKNVPPPPPIPAKATKEQKKAYKKATEKYKKTQKEVKNIPSPPPPISQKVEVLK